MTLSRQMLKAMGIEDEKIDQIIESHAETVEALKQQRNEYKAAFDELPKAKQRIEELESANNDDLAGKYEALQKEFDDYKNQIASDRARNERKALYRDLLRDSGIDEKRIDSVLRVTDFDQLEVEDGALKDAETLKENVVKEWSDFISITETRGAATDNPPANTGGHSMTKDEIYAIKDKSKRQQAMLENKELFPELANLS